MKLKKILINKLHLHLVEDAKFILEPNLGKSDSNKPDKYGLIRFYCPKCNFRKQNFSFNIITTKWKCWVCGYSGIGFNYLLKKYNISNKIKEKIKEYNYKIKRYYNVLYDDLIHKPIITLPDEYKLLSDTHRTIQYDQAMSFLMSRGLTNKEILDYKIGFCLSGKYKDMIIIPSYNNHNNLNYFVARSFNPYTKLKYKNPSALKEMIFFLNRINWDIPIILVEGVFDAITIRYNAIPLITSSINTYLLRKLIKYNPIIYLLLDGDAKRKGIIITLKLKNYGLLNVYNIIIEELKHDASSLGYNKIWLIIDLNKKEVTQLSIFINKLYKNMNGGK